MNILVCIKQVPETKQVEVDEKTGVLKREGVDSKLNPYDLYALETAFRLKEKHGGKVTVVSMGPPQAEEIIREAYMMGADEGYLLSDRKFAGADVLATAYTISYAIKIIGDQDIIICGKQTTDGDTAQVGPSIAEYLGIPHVTLVRRIVESTEDKIIVEKDVVDSIEIMEMYYPCLITVEKGIYVPRLPSYKRKLATEDKPVKVFTFKEYENQKENRCGLDGSATQVERVFPPTSDIEQEIWVGDSETLANKMFDKLTELKFI